MARTFVINLPDDLEQVLITLAGNLNKSPEEVVLQVLSQQLTTLSLSQSVHQAEADPLLRLICSLSVDIPDLAENHDYYIGQALYQELKGVE